MTTQSPLSEFEELGVGSSTWLPGTPQVSSSEVGLPPDRGQALTVLAEVRSRIGSNVPFLAMSGSVNQKAWLEIQFTLGFHGMSFNDVRLPVDRADLKYCARIRYHSVEGLEFPDFAWAIPQKLESPSDLMPTIFAINSVEKTTTFSEWLIRELHKVAPEEIDIPDLIWPFHAELHKEDRSKIQLWLMAGTIHYIVATICANVGLNLPVQHVVCVDLPKSFEEMTQWAGRVSWDGSGGMFVVYGPDDLKITAEMCDGSTKDGTYVDGSVKWKPLTQTQVAAHREYQAKVAPGLVAFFNPPPDGCQRSVFCAYFGDAFSKPAICCGTCQPDTLYCDESLVKSYITESACRKTNSKVTMLPLPKDRCKGARDLPP
ncbi:uncharacterized protein EI90DRAFT_3134989 [Cantharellus anzutake]|uniref:uncharacterized protein n=1 Tax=Cantharellus anzutake TaxID=1750568 RepID=UPI001905FBC1|nr:uncharacterized protein EI90DRAFT_3134989 [Cantharellus anzutake]KAF8315741.1 hypothetical protein EI90DRAFT_3134989 [Cantharellus anzutake]